MPGSSACEGSNVEWEAIRQSVLKRDGFACRICKSVTDLHVHHLIPRSQGGDDSFGNLVTLCGAHHGARHPTLHASLARRTLERWALALAKRFARPGELVDDLHRLRAAVRLLGKDRFLPGQLEVILAAVRGQSVLAVRPTGSGKSLCFQVPAVLADGLTVVTEPLKSTMEDQVSNLLDNTLVPSTFINRSVSGEERKLRYSMLEGGHFKLLYVAPERFDERSKVPLEEIRRLLCMKVAYLVVDEAHCILSEGESFRPSWFKLDGVRRAYGDPPLLMFTATLRPSAAKRLLQEMRVPDAKTFYMDVDRPNIALLRCDMPKPGERFDKMAKAIQQFKGKGKTLVFVPTKRVGKRVLDELRSRKIAAEFYHAREQDDAMVNQALLQRFTGRLEPVLDVMVCTKAFSLGVDVPNIRLVLHEGQPDSPEEFLQQVGRAGRDGRPALAVLFGLGETTSIQHFLAECAVKTAVKNGHLSELAAARVLSERKAAIEELKKMIANTEQCFRRQLLDYMQYERRREQRSLGMRIAGLVLGRQQRIRRVWICCDRCSPHWCDPEVAAHYVARLC